MDTNTVTDFSTKVTSPIRPLGKGGGGREWGGEREGGEREKEEEERKEELRVGVSKDAHLVSGVCVFMQLWDFRLNVKPT